jgi:hypothetical protein
VQPGDGLAWNTTYYWRASATNSYHSASAWSDSRIFKPALGPPPVQQWAALYNGLSDNGSRAASAIAVDKATGCVYVTGYFDSDALMGLSTHTDYATVKYDGAGVQLWAVKYNNAPADSIDMATAIALDSAGNAYVTGNSRKVGTSSTGIATVKYNSADGSQAWARRYEEGLGNYGIAIAVDGAGNAYVTGQTTWDRDYAPRGYITIKYNTDGVQQWSQRPGSGAGYGGGGAFAIALNASGSNVYVTGSSGGLGGTSGYAWDYATINYNSASGAVQWVGRYNNAPYNGYETARAIAVDAADNVYVTGESDNGTGYWNDYATVKYNSSGVQQWAKRYAGSGHTHDYARAIALDGAGNAYVTGTLNESAGGLNYGTIKYNSADGEQAWVATYNGANKYDEAYAVALDSAGNAYVTGYSQDGGGYPHYATVKYNGATGAQQCVLEYKRPTAGGLIMNYAPALAVDGSDNVYVTGRSAYVYSLYTGRDRFDFATVKYAVP